MYSFPGMGWHHARALAPSMDSFHAYLRRFQMDLFPDQWSEAEKGRLEQASLILSGEGEPGEFGLVTLVRSVQIPD